MGSFRHSDSNSHARLPDGDAGEELSKQDETNSTERDSFPSVQVCVGRPVGCPRREPQALANDISLNHVTLFSTARTVKFQPIAANEPRGRNRSHVIVDRKERLGVWPSLYVILARDKGREAEEGGIPQVDSCVGAVSQIAEPPPSDLMADLWHRVSIRWG